MPTSKSVVDDMVPSATLPQPKTRGITAELHQEEPVSHQSPGRAEPSWPMVQD